MSNSDRVLATVIAGAMLLPCGACSQKLNFTAADYPAVNTSLTQTPPQLDIEASVPPARPSVANALFDPAASPSTLALAGGVVAAGAELPRINHLSPQYAFDPLLADSPSDSLYGSLYGESRGPAGFGSRVRSMFQEARCKIRSDHVNYYSWPTMRDLALGITLASPIANTSIDGDFQSWYQDDVRSRDTDDFAAFWKTFGEGQIFIPAFVGLGLVGRCFEDRPLLGTVGDFGDRVTRSYLVGAPPMLLMQFTLGAGRPGETSAGSHWQSFEDTNAVSGHAFMGSVPFITAAQMAENPWAKSALYICSTFTAWSRVNDDKHYLSQAALGWWMGYLACRAVDGTKYVDKGYTLTPMVTPEMAGVGLIVRR